jgi:hypothetical protein
VLDFERTNSDLVNNALLMPPVFLA